ncbi:MAG: hypothetical protein IKI06_01795 [Prevotella sp.]|nr:hypothetical protein [Prevotella sp.]
MKKLFTLIALLTCFMGVNAAEIEDFSVDYTKVGASQIGWKDGAIQNDWITADEDGLHFYNPEPMENWWAYQLWVSSNADLEIDKTYTIHIVAKVSDGEANVRCKIGDWGSGITGNILVNTTDYEEYTFEGVAPLTSGALFIQFGDYVGTLSFKSLRITHEGKVPTPITWGENFLINGDAEGEYGDVECAWSKEWGYLMNSINQNDPSNPAIPDPHVAIIEEDPDDASNKVFASHAKAVDPALKDADGANLADNTWQNQFWINFPRAFKEGETFLLKFRYKASKACSVSTQDHTTPGSYLGGGKVGNLSFTTEWQDYEKEISAAAGMQSIAFNLTGDNTEGAETWKEDIDFYFDNLSASYMVLEEGFFAAAADVDDKDPDYDFDEAITFTDGGDGLIVATVGGTAEEEWVNEVMISTAKGNDKGFKANTIKLKSDEGPVVNDPNDWKGFEEGANGKIKLPVKGQWQISIDQEYSLINFVKLVGEEDKEVLDEIANETEVTLHGLAKKSAEWDNQFWIAGNRSLKKGEKVYVKFDYWASEDGVTVATQSHGKAKDADGNEVGDPTNYISHGLLGDLTFNVEPQTFEKVVEITDNGTWSICFNMAYPDHEVDYTITNVIWMSEDRTERLVEPEATDIFWLKVGAGTPVQYPAEPQPKKAEDLDGSGTVDVTDLSMVIDYIWAEDLKGDVNGDGLVDVTDLSLVIEAIWAED